MIENDIFCRGCRLPIQALALEEIEAATIERWVRTALSLERTYTKTGASTISSICSIPSVTWLKLIRGRWCLVASSDTSQSRLILFDGLIGLQSGIKAEFFLPGPVIDGVIDDSSSRINIALSIGTR